jgi:cell wall assembly regulator SMI1
MANSMTKFMMESSRKSITNRELDDLETTLKVKLPADYRVFLLSFNGGLPEPNLIPLMNDPADTHAMLECLFCIAEGDNLDITERNSWMEGRMPAGFIAIGEDPGGNQICLDLTPENYGKVYFWDHEEEVEEGEIPDFRNVYFVANSFQEMMDNLSVLPE